MIEFIGSLIDSRSEKEYLSKNRFQSLQAFTHALVIITSYNNMNISCTARPHAGIHVHDLMPLARLSALAQTSLLSGEMSDRLEGLNTTTYCRAGLVFRTQGTGWRAHLEHLQIQGTWSPNHMISPEPSYWPV